METRDSANSTAVQSILDYVKLRIQRDDKRMIGQLDRLDQLLESEFEGQMHKFHEGLFCLLVFHPDLNKEYSEFIVQSGFEFYVGKSICFLLHTPEPIVGVVPLEESLQSRNFKATDSRYAPFEFVRSLASKNPFEAYFPGLLFFRKLTEPNDAVYVGIKTLTSKAAIGQFSQEISKMAVEALEEARENWYNVFARKMALRGIPYCHNRETTGQESMIKFFRGIWGMRKDIGMVVRGF